MAEKTPGRKKNSKTKKAVLKPPVPIDAAVAPSSPTVDLTAGLDNNAAFHERYPGIQEEIRLRAYELYEARGRHDGFQQEDWIHAEMEILAKYQAKSA